MRASPLLFLALLACGTHNGATEPAAEGAEPEASPSAEAVTTASTAATDDPVEPPATGAPDAGHPTLPPVARPGATGGGDEAHGKPYTIVEGPVIAGGTLGFTARHGGGCAEHSFRLRPRPRSAEAPTQVVVDLFHDDGEDRCRAIKTSTVELDLERLWEADCTETLVLVAFPSEGVQTEWTLPLDPPHGCPP